MAKLHVVDIRKILSEFNYEMESAGPEYVSCRNRLIEKYADLIFKLCDKNKNKVHLSSE